MNILVTTLKELGEKKILNTTKNKFGQVSTSWNA